MVRRTVLDAAGIVTHVPETVAERAIRRFLPRVPGSIGARLVMLVVLVCVVAGLGFAILLAQRLRLAPQHDAQQRTVASLNREHDTLQASLDRLRTEAISVANTPALLALTARLATAQPPTTKELDQVAATFRGFALSGYYQQLRYLDANGHEVVRIEHNTTGTMRVPDAELQSKATRDYFLAARSAPAGSVVLSALDLNVENGAIEEPYVPTLRLSVPMYAGETLTGVVVANIAGNWLLTSIVPGADLVVTDATGQYLLNPDEEKRFGRQLQTGASLSTDYGLDIARGILAHDGRTRKAGGQYVAATGIDFDGFVTENQWTVISRVNVPPFAWGDFLSLGAVALIGMAIALGGSWFIARDLAMPVLAIEEAAREIADGDLGANIPGTERRDELGTLARSIERMTLSLARAQYSLEVLVHERTLELEQEIKSHRAAEAALARANIELKASNDELNSFAYSVSHDLRAPLRAIDGFSQTLVRDYADQFDERGRDRLHRIRAAAQRLGLMIDDILQLSRATRAELNRRPVNLSAQAHAIAQELYDGDPGRNVDITIEDGISTEGDPTLLRGVLQNLLQNAWKFTSKHEHASIAFGTVDTEHGRAVFVRDDGAGFDMEHADKLFGVFQRLHVAEDFEGSGVGLATVQRIIQRHGGRVWAEGAPDQGATFYFTLPALTQEQEGAHHDAA